MRKRFDTFVKGHKIRFFIRLKLFNFSIFPQMKGEKLWKI